MDFWVSTEKVLGYLLFYSLRKFQEEGNHFFKGEIILMWWNETYFSLKSE